MALFIAFILGFLVCSIASFRVDREMAARDAELEALRRALGV